MKYGCAPRLDMGQELTIVTLCKAMNDEPDLNALAARFCEQPVAMPLGWEALRRQRIYRERVLKETAPLLSEAVTS